jgi:hypothetical protein
MACHALGTGLHITKIHTCRFPLKSRSQPNGMHRSATQNRGDIVASSVYAFRASILGLMHVQSAHRAYLSALYSRGHLRLSFGGSNADSTSAAIWLVCCYLLVVAWCGALNVTPPLLVTMSLSLETPSRCDHKRMRCGRQYVFSVGRKCENPEIEEHSTYVLWSMEGAQRHGPHNIP